MNFHKGKDGKERKQQELVQPTRKRGKSKVIFRGMHGFCEQRAFMAADDKPKPEEPGGYLHISVMRPGQISPELMDFLYGKQDKETLPLPDDAKPKPEDYQKGLKIAPSSTEVPRKKKPGEPAESLVDTRHQDKLAPEMEKYLRPQQTQRLVFDPKTGKPILEGPKPKLNNLNERIKRGFAREMLGKDKRLYDDARDEIYKVVEGRLGEVGQNGKTIGDLVREEVERYLAKRPPKITLQIDAEAGVRILELHFDNMFAYRFEEINPDSKQATEAEVLAAIEAIPKARLGELSLSWVTIKSLMGSIADYTIYPRVRKAIEEKLKN